jgi:hypothetical protein
MSDAPDRRVLLGRVDELARQREDEARRLQEEVPVLTDVVDGKEPVDDSKPARARWRTTSSARCCAGSRPRFTTSCAARCARRC